MYRIIERYRGDYRLTPEFELHTCKTLAEVREYIKYTVPHSQANDYVVVGHGRTVRASEIIESDS